MHLPGQKKNPVKYIEYSPEGVFVIDDTGRYIEVNRAACVLVGSKGEMSGGIEGSA